MLHSRFPSPALRGHSPAFHRRHAPPLQFGIGSASHAAERRPPVSADYLATRPSAGSCGPVRTTFALWPRQPGLQFPKAKRVYHIGRGRVNRKHRLECCQCAIVANSQCCQSPMEQVQRATGKVEGRKRKLVVGNWLPFPDSHFPFPNLPTPLPPQLAIGIGNWQHWHTGNIRNW